MTVRNLADCVISMDADLQDDINAIDEMLEKFENENCDIVYGVRDNRDTDTVFKRRTAGAFYKLMQGLGSQSVPNHADFRLMSRRALDGLAQFPEQNLFLRGMVPPTKSNNSQHCRSPTCNVRTINKMASNNINCSYNS